MVPSDAHSLVNISCLIPFRWARATLVNVWDSHSLKEVTLYKMFCKQKWERLIRWQLWRSKLSYCEKGRCPGPEAGMQKPRTTLAKSQKEMGTSVLSAQGTGFGPPPEWAWKRTLNLQWHWCPCQHFGFSLVRCCTQNLAMLCPDLWPTDNNNNKRCRFVMQQ